MEIERKVPEEKKIKVFWVKVKVKVVNVEKILRSGIFIYLVRTHSLGGMLIEKFNHMG